jgi:hypothetical protein
VSASDGAGFSEAPRPADEVPSDPWAELVATVSRPDSGEEARAAWLSDLEVEGKHQLLCELELLLKGIACFANPRNHPGAARPKVAAIDWSWHLAYLRDGIARAAALAGQLLGDRARPLVTRRHLATKLPVDARLQHAGAAETSFGSPDDSLLALRHGLLHALAVAEGTLALQRVPFRLFYAQASLLARDIGRNEHWSPLHGSDVSMDPGEGDARAMLAVVRAAAGEVPRRLVALTLLRLVRMAQQVRLVGDIAAASGEGARQNAGRIYLILAVLRYEARALAVHLQKRAPLLLADSFEAEVLAAPASDLAGREEALLARGRSLASLSFVLDSVAVSLRLEMRRTYLREVPAPDAGVTDEELLARLCGAAGELRPRLERMTAPIAQAVGAPAPLVASLDDEETRERVHRDVWMFAQILRAFASKAEAARSLDRWETANGLAFAREFNAYFQALGCSLLQASGYPRFDELVRAVRALADADLLDGEALQRATAEARSAEVFLGQLFDAMTQREAVRGVPFDRRAAARSLRRYLND